jgi:vancomycin permeability regulator SanA
MPREATASDVGTTDQVGTRIIAPFLFAVAAFAEVLAMLLATTFRYRNQGLEPQFLDLSKSANLLSMLVVLPFILVFITLASLRRYRNRTRLAVAAAAMSCSTLVLLSITPIVPPGRQDLLDIVYLLAKAFELAYFVALLQPIGISAWRRGMRVVIYMIALVLLSLLSVIVAVLVSPIDESAIEAESHESYDAGVILGAAVWSGDKPSPVLRERINKGYDLLKDGTVQFLVLTGGNAPNELPEAEVARRELLKRGADPTRLLIETHTSSTVQQVVYIRDQLLKQGWSSFVIISDQFHLKRALEICRFNGIHARGVSSESPLGPQNLALYHFRESVALILYWVFGV